VPEKAKHYYLQQPEQMKQSITSFITTPLKCDAYTLCHAFGDKYGIEVYVNEYHIQACAGVPLGYIGYSQLACFSEKSNGQYTLCLSVKTHNVPRHRIRYTTSISIGYKLAQYCVHKQVTPHVKSVVLGPMFPATEHRHVFKLPDFVEPVVYLIRTATNATPVIPTIIRGKKIDNQKIQLGAFKAGDSIELSLPVNHHITKIYLITP
jgi:hypothetical protein